MLLSCGSSVEPLSRHAPQQTVTRDRKGGPQRLAQGRTPQVGEGVLRRHLVARPSSRHVPKAYIKYAPKVFIKTKSTR
jgi:hypothetical protein